MDAMLKRRMWKVAISHFIFTFLIIVGAYFSSFVTSPGNWTTWQRFDNSYIFRAYLNNFLGDVFFLFQPQFWVSKFFSSDWFFWASLILIPFWSICFAWLFVKLDNWLNHFPVLGKRVF